jgi:hypothetical protein
MTLKNLKSVSFCRTKGDYKILATCIQAVQAFHNLFPEYLKDLGRKFQYALYLLFVKIDWLNLLPSLGLIRRP